VNRDQKAAVIDRLAGQLESAEAVFAIDYRGLSVQQAVELRTSLTAADATFTVAKNTLTERAADKAGTEQIKPLLEGPTALTFVNGDVAVAAKALATFRRQNNVLEFKGGQLGGEVLSIDQIESIARLPARDVLIGQFVGVVASPITGVVRGLNALISGLAIQLGAIAEQGLVSGAAPPAEAAPEAASEPEAETAAGEGAEASAPEAAAEPEAETAAGAGAEASAEAEAPAEAAAEAETEAPAEAEAEAEAEAPADEPAETEASTEAGADAPADADTESPAEPQETPEEPAEGSDTSDTSETEEG
jgi:large subunit ribosomal protein L10